MGTILLHFNQEFERWWESLDRRLEIAPGKDVLAKINDLLQNELKTTLTDAMIIDQIIKDSLDVNFVKVLEELEAFCSM